MASLIIPRQRRVGLVIGNANYRAGGPLANPRRDAEATARRLHEFEFELVDGGPHFDLDQGRFRGTLESFGAQIRGSNVALFYYSGHGIQLDGRNYLIPVDVPPRDPTTIILRMINIADILHLVERSDNRLNILILDACRDNPFSALSGHRSVTEGLTELPPPSGTIICYSALPGHVALDGKEGGHSPFAEALLEAMTEKADSSVLDFFDIVAERVYRKTDGRQRPLCQSSILGDARGFRFRPRRAELEAAAWAQLPSSADGRCPPGVPCRLSRWRPLGGGEEPTRGAARGCGARAPEIGTCTIGGGSLGATAESADGRCPPGFPGSLPRWRPLRGREQRTRRAALGCGARAPETGTCTIGGGSLGATAEIRQRSMTSRCSWTPIPMVRTRRLQRSNW